MSVGRNPSQGTLLRASEFLIQELPIRLAKRVMELDNLPKGLAEMASIVRVKHWYAESFQELIACPKVELPEALRDKYRHKGKQSRYYSAFDPADLPSLPSETVEYNRKFKKLLETIKRRHDPVVTTVGKQLEIERKQIALGVYEWKRNLKQIVTNTEIQEFLDRFYMSRIGIRVLIGQHVALQQSGHSKDYVGIICTNTNIRQIAQEAIDNATFICEDHYGLFNAPKVILECPNDLSFMYIPSHLHHMLFEVLKNSLRATVETVGPDNEEKFPTIRLNVTHSDSKILVKIIDEGGGISEEGMKWIWSYMYTTAQVPFLDPTFSTSDFKAPLAGFGYGLPISRLYARYFGGNLELTNTK